MANQSQIRTPNLVLVGGIPTPLQNDGVRQLGWWNSQYMESHKIHVRNHQPVVSKSYSLLRYEHTRIPLIFNVSKTKTNHWSVFSSNWPSTWTMNTYMKTTIHKGEPICEICWIHLAHGEQILCVSIWTHAEKYVSHGFLNVSFPTCHTLLKFPFLVIRRWSKSVPCLGAELLLSDLRTEECLLAGYEVEKSYV